MVLSRQLGLHCDTCLEFSLRGHGIISVSCRVNWTMQGFAKMCMPTGLDIFGVILACISEVSSPLALCGTGFCTFPLLAHAVSETFLQQSKSRYSR